MCGWHQHEARLIVAVDDENRNGACCSSDGVRERLGHDGFEDGEEAGGVEGHNHDGVLVPWHEELGPGSVLEAGRAKGATRAGDDEGGVVGVLPRTDRSRCELDQPRPVTGEEVPMGREQLEDAEAFFRDVSPTHAGRRA